MHSHSNIRKMFAFGMCIVTHDNTTGFKRYQDSRLRSNHYIPLTTNMVIPFTSVAILNRKEGSASIRFRNMGLLRMKGPNGPFWQRGADKGGKRGSGQVTVLGLLQTRLFAVTFVSRFSISSSPSNRPQCGS